MPDSTARPSEAEHPSNSQAFVRGSGVSVADEQAFNAASEHLRMALNDAAEGREHADIAGARLQLRAMAVKMRDSGFWRTDKQGLRATVSLLWQADRFVNEQALRGIGNGTAP